VVTGQRRLRTASIIGWLRGCDAAECGRFGAAFTRLMRHASTPGTVTSLSHRTSGAPAKGLLIAPPSSVKLTAASGARAVGPAVPSAPIASPTNRKDLACVADSTGVTRCVPFGTEGDSCDTARCETNLVCASADASEPRLCRVPSAGPGDACDEGLGPFCDTRRRIFCDRSSGKCVAPRTVGPEEQCGALDDGTFADCDVRTFCRRNARTDPTGVCAALFIPDGSECQVDSSGSPDCEFPAICAHALGATTGTRRLVGTEYCR
jgi:hypothetical protein